MENPAGRKEQAMTTTPVRRTGRGWITFAALMLIVAGTMDILNGWWAVGAQDSAIDAVFWDNNIEAWGWFYIVLGAFLVVTGIAIFRRAAWAAMVGIFAGCVGAVLNIFWIFQYPFASLVLITLNVLVVHALRTYGEDFD
jgi:hypothetical protein